MSASTEKKNRRAAREAGTDKKTLAQEKELKEAAKSRRKWTIGLILVAVFIVITLLLNSGILFKSTTALKVGGHSVSPAELSYYYGSERSMYSQYASYYGMDMSAFMSEEDMKESAVSSITQVKALCDYANANGIALDENEIKEISDNLAYTELQAISGGYKNLDMYFSLNFGTGVTRDLAEKIMLEQALAEKARQFKNDSIEYSDAQLDEYYKGLDGDGDCFDYDYYYIAADTVEGEPDADGNPTSSVTDDTLAAAKSDADAIAEAYKASEAEDASERFSEAVDSVLPGSSSSNSNNVAGSSLNAAFKDWLKDSSRKEGDITVCENTGATGYYVVVFKSRSDNSYKTVSMRHILIKAAADENGEYSDEALAEARGTAEAIYTEWKSGEMSEDSFAELANSRSDDTGSNTNGGLYEDIYRGQMVPEINDYVFGGRKHGDSEIIDVVSGSYAGTHIVYFVGEGDPYCRVIARNDMRSDEMSTWEEELLAGYEAVHGWTFGLIGK